MLLHFDGTFIVILISFIIFAVIMNHIFYLPMRRVIEERDEYIFINSDEANKLKEQSDNILKEYYVKIKEARLKAQQKIEDSTIAGKQSKLDIIKTANENADQEINIAKKSINEEKNSAIETLKPEVGNLAQMITSKILGIPVSISGIDQEKVDKILRG